MSAALITVILPVVWPFVVTLVKKVAGNRVNEKRIPFASAAAGALGALVAMFFGIDIGPEAAGAMQVLANAATGTFATLAGVGLNQVARKATT